METTQTNPAVLAEIVRLEDEYDALALIPDHRWGHEQSQQLQAVVSRLSELYEVADVPELDRIVL